MITLKGLQPVWEQSIVDKNKTTAELIPGTPVKKEIVFTTTEEWEGFAFRFPNVLYDNGKYRMYYLTNKASYCVCYAESDDGLHWVKPSLGICEYKGSRENNILLLPADKPEENAIFDNFFVFLDTNPNTDPNKKYKALVYMNVYRLGYYSSPDGIHFTYEMTFDVPGKFDTLNVGWWDEEIKRYVAYIRDFHDVPGDDLNAGIRDVRRMESEDFVHWTTPELITFNETADYPLYTNNIRRYYRNPDIYIGFPSRYEERPDWSDSFEQLCGKEGRLRAMEKMNHKRAGLTVTDSIFMASRDGLHWDKIDEAFFTPGPEFSKNWLYGNCYNAYHMIETPSDDGENTELSLFVSQYYDQRDDNQAVMERYTIRRDGFACYKAKFNGAKFVTKPFVFDGDEMYINFSTSAKGYIYITIKDSEGNTAKTCELFGDSDERKVTFENANIRDFAGKEVTLEFDMRDSRLYSFVFK